MIDLRLGDCLEILPTLSGVDAVITDPPYGVDAASGWAGDLYGNVAAVWNGGSISNDKNFAMRDFIIEWTKTRNIPLAVFGSARKEEPEGYIARLIWDKGGAAGMGDLSIPWKPDYDFIHVFGRGWAGARNSSILRAPNIPRISMGRTHPHEKPVSLMMQLIEKTPEGCTILDPFMGSGSTGVAAVKLGRNFIGCEINPDHFETAPRRIAEAQAQMVMPL